VTLAELSRDLSALVARAATGVVGIDVDRGQGSGVVLSADGYVLTNAHVARTTGRLRIRLPGGRSVEGRRVGADPRTDLAVVRGDTTGLRPLALAEGPPEVGQIVVAIGNPLGFDRSVSLGVVSALFRDLPSRAGVLEGLIQTDAAVNPGNSGGPLLDVEGRVVGINTAMIAFASGIGFAVPAQTASWVAAVLMRYGEVRRPFLGIRARGEELEAGLAREVGQARAIRIVGVEPSAPAAEAGVAASDLLLSANARAVATLDDLSRVLVLSAPAALDLEVLREGGRRHFQVWPRPQAA
jgi:S1-C subfamily serine protease